MAKVIGPKYEDGRPDGIYKDMTFRMPWERTIRLVGRPLLDGCDLRGCTLIGLGNAKLTRCDLRGARYIPDGEGTCSPEFVCCDMRGMTLGEAGREDDTHVTMRAIGGCKLDGLTACVRSMAGSSLMACNAPDGMRFLGTDMRQVEIHYGSYGLIEMDGCAVRGLMAVASVDTLRLDGCDTMPRGDAYDRDALVPERPDLGEGMRIGSEVRVIQASAADVAGGRLTACAGWPLGPQDECPTAAAWEEWEAERAAVPVAQWAAGGGTRLEVIAGGRPALSICAGKDGPMIGHLLQRNARWDVTPREEAALLAVETSVRGPKGESRPNVPGASEVIGSAVTSMVTGRKAASQEAWMATGARLRA